MIAFQVGGKVKMELVAKAGQHAVKGNMLAIEYDTYRTGT